MAYLQFPPSNDIYSNEIPVWLSFKVGYYSSFARFRKLNYIKSNWFGQIVVPYPKAMSTLNSQNYQAGGSLNVRAIEIGGIRGVVESLKQEITAKAELAQSFLSGGGVIRFDHLETILLPGARRTHVVVMDLVAKTAEQAVIINDIASTFQTNVFPIANTSSILTMRHPPLWAIEAFTSDGTTGKFWDGQPLVSVLQSVDVNRSPINNIPYTTGNYRPLAVNIKLNFIELEPAMQVGNGTDNIFSRSDRV